MYYFITELDKRPDGIVNTTLTTRQTLATGLSFYYQRAAAAVTSEQFTGVALTLQNENGKIMLNEHFNTIYVPEPVEPEEETGE